MKAEHRKELQTNALADRIGRFFTGLRSSTRSSSLFLWLVIILLAGGALTAWILINRGNKKARSEMLVTMDNLPTQEELNQAMRFHSGGKGELLEETEDKLNAIIDKYPGTPAALQARFYLAQIDYQARGLDQLMTPGKGKSAVDSLKKARKSYEQLGEDCKDDPYWEPKALLPVAKIVETLAVDNIDNLDKARDLYADLAQKYPDSSQGKEAKRRLKELKDSDQLAEIKKFYADLKTGI
jgi:flagellar basal body-associated protein FliL